MPVEPQIKRCYAFFDGQNLFHAAREAFDYPNPGYDPPRLATIVCLAQEWSLEQVHFYTGIHSPDVNPDWHDFWMRKLSALAHRGVKTFRRPLRYRTQRVRHPDGSVSRDLVGHEKGIDVRIALDIVRLARKNLYDVALVFSQDQDLAEAFQEVRTIAREQDRWIKVATAFPWSERRRNTRGIDASDWIPIEQDLYDRCLEARDVVGPGEPDPLLE